MFHLARVQIVAWMDIMCPLQYWDQSMQSVSYITEKVISQVK